MTGNATFDLAVVATGFSSPVHVVAPPDQSGRLFVVEQVGLVRIVQDGAILPETFLDARDRVRSGGEEGLLSIAFDPRFNETMRFYVYYTDLESNVVIERGRANPRAPGIADTFATEILLTIAHPYGNHNGGLLLFGPEGLLYAGVGDGGSGGDPHGNGQSRDTLLGKLLRINVSATTGYTIPADNPFARGGGKPEIWAYGLRNPWRFSFDRETGDLFIGDVGQNAREEIDYAPWGGGSGANYGWNVWEGTKRYRLGEAEDAVFPVHEYPTDDGCSIVVGPLYRGFAIPSLRGALVFADYCNGRIQSLGATAGPDGEPAWTTRTLLESGRRISSFGEDGDGEVLVVDHAGAVLRLVASEG